MERLTTALRAIHALVLWGLIALLTVFFTALIALAALLLWPVDRRRKAPHWIASLWGRAVFRCHPAWRISVEGARHLPRRGAYVLAANHQSLLDIMALYHLRRQFKWVAKEELFGVPFLGWSMALAGYVKLARGKNRSIRDAYANAQEWLTGGMPVLFFPEGTRSETGVVGPFKNGAFRLAAGLGIPVVPIAVAGTRDLLIKGSWRFRPGRQRVRVVVLPPLPPAAAPESVRDQARAAILAVLERP